MNIIPVPILQNIIKQTINKFAKVPLFALAASEDFIFLRNKTGDNNTTLSLPGDFLRCFFMFSDACGM